MSEKPGFWDVARRPEWVWTLIGCLVVAGIFGLLANWQTARAIEQGQGDERDTETPVTLESVAAPGEILTTEAGGRIVTVTAAVDPDSFVILEGRHQEGESGCWITSRGIVTEGAHEGASIALAIDFMPDCEGIEPRISEIQTNVEPQQLVGRYMPSEAPSMADFESGEVSMSIAALINLWEDYEPPVFSGYLLLHDSDNPAQSLSIHSEPPETQTQLNWLNIFYAIEWVAFGGFAIYLWYRLVQDVREREGESDDDDDDFDFDDDEEPDAPSDVEASEPEPSSVQ